MVRLPALPHGSELLSGHDAPHFGPYARHPLATLATLDVPVADDFVLATFRTRVRIPGELDCERVGKGWCLDFDFCTVVEMHN